jgi:peptide/nickel transport system permease protein
MVGRRSAVEGQIARRFALAIPVLFGVSILTYFVPGVLPGSAAQQLLGADATPSQIAALEAELGLDRPAWQRYLEWVGSAVRGDLGTSIASGQPVIALLQERLPITLQLVTYAFVLSIGLAVPTALFAARWPNKLWDKASSVVSMLGLAVPNYVLALVLVLVFSVQLRLFPSIGFTPLGDDLVLHFQSLTLPALAMALPLVAFYSRFLRGDLLEQLHTEDYVTAAVAKGVGPWRVILVHVLRNSIFGLLVVIGLNFGALIGGTVIIEQLFALPGVGQLLLQAISVRDVVVIQAVVLCLAVATVLASCCTDVLCALLDPRIRHAA